MRASTNAFLAAVAIISLIGGAQKPVAKQNASPVYHEPVVQTVAPVQRPTLDVRPALWTDSQLPATYQPVNYTGGGLGCADGSCSILGLARRESAGEASGPVRRVFSGLAERRPVRRLLGRLRCR